MGPQAVFCARLLVLRPVGLKTPVKDALEGLVAPDAGEDQDSDRSQGRVVERVASHEHQSVYDLQRSRQSVERHQARVEDQVSSARQIATSLPRWVCRRVGGSAGALGPTGVKH